MYGIGVGSDRYVQLYLEGKVEEIWEVVLQGCDLFQEDLQAE